MYCFLFSIQSVPTRIQWNEIYKEKLGLCKFGQINELFIRQRIDFSSKLKLKNPNNFERFKYE